MALIGKIRKMKWLLIGMIAGALGLFIVQLMVNDQTQTFFGSSRTSIGEVEGRSIEYQEFANTHEMLYSNANSDGFSDREFLWNYYVDETVVKEEAEAIGLGVSHSELVELQFGEDESRLSPIITNSYKSQTTGRLDRDQLNQLKDIIMNNKIDEMITNNQLMPDFKYRWAHQENQIIKERLQTKITKMVEKGMYVPNWMAESIGAEQGQQVDFLYVQIPFDEIENKSVTLSDDDYKAYFEENKNQYKQKEETRKLEYVTFDVKATAKDSTDIQAAVAKLADDFRKAENDTVFVENNLGTIDGTYVKKSDLPAAIADSITAMPVGSVVGPYLDLNSYKAAKLLGVKSVPDSVKARHILRPATDPASLAAAQKTIDSLKALLEAGTARFDSLAVKFSSDGSASKGGDLGTFGPGRMVPEFNEVCFYKADLGKYYSVTTQFGVHLIELTAKYGSNTSYRVAYVSQNIVPSEATQNAVREQALQMQEENKTLDALRKAAAAKGLTTETSAPLKVNDYAIGQLPIGQNSREMVLWAFGNSREGNKANVGDVSPTVYDFQNPGEFHVSKYVVAALKSKLPAGIPSWKDVKEEIEPQVINRKKAELVKQQTAGKDLASIASQYATQVDTATAVSFASAFLPKAGNTEPKVVATCFKTELNKQSEPVVGNSGIFVVMPTNKPAAAPPSNLAQVRQASQMSIRAFVRNGLIQGLRESADIEDNRARFF